MIFYCLKKREEVKSLDDFLNNYLDLPSDLILLDISHVSPEICIDLKENQNEKLILFAKFQFKTENFANVFTLLIRITSNIFL
jgi:hypothetical protein